MLPPPRTVGEVPLSYIGEPSREKRFGLSDAWFLLKAGGTTFGFERKLWKFGIAIIIALTLSEVPLVIAARKILSTLLPQISWIVGYG